jgi:hypothetical protein
MAGWSHRPIPRQPNTVLIREICQRLAEYGQGLISLYLFPAIVTFFTIKKSYRSHNRSQKQGTEM